MKASLTLEAWKASAGAVGNGLVFSSGLPHIQRLSAAGEMQSQNPLPYSICFTFLVSCEGFRDLRAVFVYSGFGQRLDRSYRFLGGVWSLVLWLF